METTERLNSSFYVTSGSSATEIVAKQMLEELAELFREDQADRSHNPSLEDWPEISERDQARRKRVLELLAAGFVEAPEDYYHAAMIFQHGDSTTDYWRAHELANHAAEQHYRPARWLAAATYDRWLMSQQLPQKYGTQYVADSQGWRLYKVDPSTTDQERAEWDVPPLAEAQQHAATISLPTF